MFVIFLVPLINATERSWNSLICNTDLLIPIPAKRDKTTAKRQKKAGYSQGIPSQESDGNTSNSFLQVLPLS